MFSSNFKELQNTYINVIECYVNFPGIFDAVWLPGLAHQQAQPRDQVRQPPVSRRHPGVHQRVPVIRGSGPDGEAGPRHGDDDEQAEVRGQGRGGPLRQDQEVRPPGVAVEGQELDLQNFQISELQ